MPPSNLRSAVEALLFSSDQPLTLVLLAEALETPAEDVTAALQSLGEEFTARGAGVELREMAGGWIFATVSEQHEWVGRMLRGKRKMRLSRAALETMAIVAYKQPVTKSEIEAIRGVDASGVLATLLERNLVTIKGRSTVVGRPLLYGTTPEFLNYFGLRDLTELPRPEELRALVAAREPEQLEMMELDPESGMPLALAAASVIGVGAAVPAAALALAAGVAGAEGDAVAHPDAAHTAGAAAHTHAFSGIGPEGDEDGDVDADTAFSLADADAAIAQANAARADAALAMSSEDVPAGSVHAGAGDLETAGDDDDDGDADGDEALEDDEDEDFDDAYDDDDEDEDDDDEEEEDDEDEEDEAGERPSLSVDEHGGH